MPALAAGTLEPALYGRILQAHLSILAPWEHAHAAWLAALPVHGWRYRPRVPALRHDLHALGEPLPPVAGAAEASIEAAQAWGMLYVVEGSMLGGRVIARQLRRQQPSLEGALAYFDLGSEEPAAWRRFQDCLERALTPPGAREQAAAGARAMFARFHQQLCFGRSV